jgi:hypothetical protein
MIHVALKIAPSGRPGAAAVEEDNRIPLTSLLVMNPDAMGFDELARRLIRISVCHGDISVGKFIRMNKIMANRPVVKSV